MFDLIVFSDGGCIGNPGPGGWAAVTLRGGHYEEFGGGEDATTNNRMEMLAAIEGLTRAKKGEKVKVVTDSRYLVDGASKWIYGWKRKNWMKADGHPVLNRDLWERIDELSSGLLVTWEHTPGHSGHPENERCDRIANSFARGEGVELRAGDGSWLFAGPGGEGEEPYKKPIYLSVVCGDVREHSTWPECEARIKGIKGARCKKVASRAEHIAALSAWKDLA